MGAPDRELGHHVSDSVTVRIFGSLRPACEAAGRPFVFDFDVADGGVSGTDLAVVLGLPADKIEGVFVNHTVQGMGHTIRPGDRIAFVPYDTPGPHRVFLGLYEAGKSAR